MNREETSDLSSNCCSSKSKELKNLLAAGGHRGRIQKNDCNGWKFVGKYSVNKNDNERDEISEENTLDIDDNIIINISNLQEHL